MAHLKFDVAKLEKLNDPGRFETLIPDVMWDALGRPDPDVVVEIGGGTGLFAARFAKMAPHAVFYLCDTEDVMLEWVRANRPEVAERRIVPVRSEESSVPLADALAEMVYMINLHHELKEPSAVYGEALRLLRPGGQVLVADWAPLVTPKGPPMSVRVSAARLAGFLLEAGFESVEGHEGLPWHVLLTGVKPLDRGSASFSIP